MSARHPVSGWINLRLLGLLAAGALIGVLGVVGFNVTMAATSTQEFCLSCHNHDSHLARFERTVHSKNAAGVGPICADCHIPHDFLPKLKRKLEASHEVLAQLQGTIDTEEKYRAREPELREKEMARFRANDSANCRYCHDVARMAVDQQSPMAQRSHAKIGQGKTCVDCHEDAGHVDFAELEAPQEESVDP